MVPVVPVAGDAELPGAVLPEAPLEVLSPMLPAPDEPLPMELVPDGLVPAPDAPLPIDPPPELLGGQFMLDAPEVLLAPVGGQSAVALPPEEVLPAPEAPELPMLLPEEDEGIVDEGEEGLVDEGAAEGLLELPMLEPLALLSVLEPMLGEELELGEELDDWAMATPELASRAIKSADAMYFMIPPRGVK